MKTYLKPTMEIILLAEDDVVKTSGSEWVESGGGNSDGVTFE